MASHSLKIQSTGQSQQKIFSVNKSTGQPVVELYRGYSNNQLAGLEVVHASKQPPGGFMLSMYVCVCVCVC